MIDDDHKLDLMPGMVEAGVDALLANTDAVNENDYPEVWRTTVAEIYRAMEQSRVDQIEMAQKRATDFGVEGKDLTMSDDEHEIEETLLVPMMEKEIEDVCQALVLAVNSLAELHGDLGVFEGAEDRYCEIGIRLRGLVANNRSNTNG